LTSAGRVLRVSITAASQPEAVKPSEAPVDKSLVGVAIEPILLRIRAEYLEMPGLRLTRAQAQRLWGLDAETCLQFLEQLTSERFLDRSANGTYARRSDSATAFPAGRKVMAAALTTSDRIGLKAG
jgi:hypothetical protein